jgi:hypothetical protein
MHDSTEPHLVIPASAGFCIIDFPQISNFYFPSLSVTSRVLFLTIGVSLGFHALSLCIFTLIEWVVETLVILPSIIIIMFETLVASHILISASARSVYIQLRPSADMFQALCKVFWA